MNRISIRHKISNKAEDKPELQEPTTKERTWDGMNNYDQLPEEKKTSKKLHNLTNRNKSPQLNETK
jgi:hypothetical protein